MINVTIKFYSYIKFETGLDTIQISLPENTTLQNLLEELEKKYGDSLMKYLIHQGKKKPIALFIIENQMCEISHLLHDGDVIKAMPTIAGG